MREGKSFSQRWQEYQPSKGVWLWSCVACIVLTMIVGFTWGGWVTGGSAQTMAAQAEQEAREQLIASICVERFVNEPNAAGNLAELKEASTYDQDNYIEEGGWITVEALEDQVTEAADLCADRLVAMEGLPERAVAPEASTTETSTSEG
jgi:hypothetical protein